MSHHPTYNPCLEIKQSLVTGANLGLFTTCDIPVGKFVDVYHGQVYTNREYDRLEESLSEEEKAKIREYVFYDSDHRKNICPSSEDCYARFANDITLQGRLCNAEFTGFEYEKDIHNTPRALAHFGDGFSLPLSQQKATICIRAVCHISKGDEIYVSYGSDYWIGEKAKQLKQRLLPSKRKYRRVVRVIKTKLENRRKYLCRKRKQSAAVTHHQTQEAEVPVWPESPFKDQEVVMAKWSKDTAEALPCREAGILSYDPEGDRWLILTKKKKGAANKQQQQQRRFAFSQCALPPL